MSTTALYQPPHVETDGDVTTVTLTANPVRVAENAIARQLDEVPAGPNQHVLVNFTNVDYLNGVELGTLIALHKRVRRAGGRLTLFNLATHLEELFTVTRLNTVLTVCQEGNGELRNSEPLPGVEPQREVLLMNAPRPPFQTDREMVLDFQPTARVESRVNSRSDRSEYRVVHRPAEGRRAELGPWCGSEQRAWEAACLRQGLHLRRGN